VPLRLVLPRVKPSSPSRENAKSHLGVGLSWSVLNVWSHQGIDFSNLGQDGEQLPRDPLSTSAARVRLHRGVEDSPTRCREDATSSWWAEKCSRCLIASPGAAFRQANRDVDDRPIILAQFFDEATNHGFDTEGDVL